MLSSALAAKFRNVKLLSLDLDGTLTDGGIYYTDEGTELRKYFVQDGFGIQLLHKAGFATCLITQSDTPGIARRAERLKIPHAYFGIHDKLPVLKKICAALGIGLDAVAHIGDDLNDLELLQAIGLPLAPANARPEVKAAAAYVTEAAGGQGAVREICDLLLRRDTL